MVIRERKRIITEQIIENDPPVVIGALTGSNPMVRPLGDASLGMLVLRLMLGSVFIMHGGQKVFGWFGGQGLDATAQFMANMGISAALSYSVSFIEFFGGVAILLGLLTRFAALGIMGVMAGAIVMVHLNKGFFAPQGYEYPLTLAVMALAIFLLGPGRYSLDQVIFKRRSQKPGQPAPVSKIAPRVRRAENIR